MEGSGVLVFGWVILLHFLLGLLASLLRYYKVLLATLLCIALVMKTQRKEAPASPLVGQDDILETVLSYVDLATLVTACSAVCKSWNAVIRDPSFRRHWCQRSGHKESLRVMTSSFVYGNCHAWDPSSRSVKFLLPHKREGFIGAQVVASAGGLVCVLRTNRELLVVSPSDDVFHLVVGNPVTQEWTELSPLHWEDRERYEFAGVIDFTMLVDDKNGFKLGLHYTAVEFSGHWCCIYDSATRRWSSLPKLPFSPAYAKAKEQRLADYRVETAPRAVFPDMDDYFYDPSILGFYDVGRGRWRSSGEAVRSLRITTGLEDRVDEFHGSERGSLRCVLPQPGLSTARLWEYNGQRYFASGWVYAGGPRERGDSGADGYAVWKICDDDKGGGGRLAVVSARNHEAIVRQVYARKRVYGMAFRCSVHAEANLVVFSESAMTFVYDLSTGEWGGGGVGEEGDFSKAVIFRPSLRTPW